MNSQLFEILNASTAVKMLFGSNPLRIYPWGRAPQDVKKPYGVYGVYNALPENYLDRVPNIDNKGTQLEIYADSAVQLEQAGVVIRTVVEPHAHLTSYSVVDRDDETDLYGYRFEFDFWETR